MSRHGTAIRLAALLLLPLAGIAAQQEKVDVATIERIRHEATERSQVMDIMSWLTDVHGPRLTNSPIMDSAAAWSAARMREWGLSNVHFAEWGPFGRGWVTERFNAQINKPYPFQLIGYLGAWSEGTGGPKTGQVVRVRLDSMADIEANRGKLSGKWVVMAQPVSPATRFDPTARRWTDDELAAMAAIEPPTVGQQQAGQGGNRQFGGGATGPNMAQERARFLVEEGVLGILAPGRGDGGGTMIVSGGGSRTAGGPAAVPTINLAAEHYGRIWRMLERNVPVEIEIDARVRFYDRDNSYNIIAEIPGTDPQLKDEVVMIGAHFDSWHTGTGATDNAAGSATMLEAMRILKALNLSPRRTIRIGLWTGEEQGLLGSRGWVNQNLATREEGGLRLLPAHDRFSAYFNLDNGTGKIRGVYQQSNPAVGPIFDAWMAPFKDGGMKTLSITNTGGTDHLSFDGIGLPGFQFIQDPIEYSTRTHHSNMDVYERIQADDMKWNAAVLAAFAWQAAQRDEKLPRKPLPANVVR